MAKPSQLLWSPQSHLNAAYALRHSNPQLVGRLPRPRKASFLAAAKMAQHQPKAPKAAKAPRPSKAPKVQQSQSFQPAKPLAANQPAVPRAGPPLGTQPPAGSQPPHLITKGSPLAQGSPQQLNTSLPGLPPKLP